MTLVELVNLLKSIGYPVAYSHFENSEENPAPDPPFICYVLPDTDNFMADNTVYHDITDVDIELYTDVREFAIEKQIDDLLKENKIPFNKTAIYIDSEKMHQTIYEVRLI